MSFCFSKLLSGGQAFCRPLISALTGRMPVLKTLRLSGQMNLRYTPESFRLNEEDSSLKRENRKQRFRIANGKSYQSLAGVTKVIARA